MAILPMTFLPMTFLPHSFYVHGIIGSTEHAIKLKFVSVNEEEIENILRLF